MTFYSNQTRIAEAIMQLLARHHRGLASESGQQAAALHCFKPHWDRILRALQVGQPIQFVLPAFPAKSPNLDKTAGVLPDLGERLALRFLDQLCQKISALYSPGAQILICSDGRVFNDLVNVTDKAVDAYAEGIRCILREDLLVSLTTFALDDYFGAIPYAVMREKLVKDYGETLPLIKERVKTDGAAKALFNGIHRFIYEDQLVSYHAMSKNQVKNLTKEIAYSVIQRSNAWSRFVEKCFPDAVRLSIHPQPFGSEKLGIMLLKSKDVWATPWHRVVLYDGREHLLVRKKEAETLGAKPVFVHDQFSHYAL
ncbi:isocyanide synthase family protein [Aquicella lusitana]|uniref:Pyoverdine/dityrosine biosynthesis protein Dit1 n=1 Tax=Aquicella lusitana TaxID=254246 RepID=A0A370GHX9_9COXI|nr:isocyanide synthase family protein [Aquicella lusitana]RDI41523.1 pyoverdine/dityrosine biosynthesis protein Dit1 [Aquicella lusitana]VVC72583.1 hypothetical protein AQULUS_02960 [Aquicella lusitana]